MIKRFLTVITGMAVAFLIFAIFFEVIGCAIIGFWYNPFTDIGFHTVVKTHRYHEDPWNHTQQVWIYGSVWHNIDVMSEKTVGSIDLTFDSSTNNNKDNLIKYYEDSFYRNGAALIKTAKP